MITVSIKVQEILKIEDAGQEIFYGSNQDWYTKRWQRLSGCGPSTVTNIIYYLNNRQEDRSGSTPLTKEECLRLMNEIWNYVTPSFGGVSSTGMLCKGAQKYLDEKKLKHHLDYLDIPKKEGQRPGFLQVIEFLRQALEKDSPVAFLNLEHGSVNELDSWHWVTIVSLEYDVDQKIAFVTIFDCGTVKRIDLSAWLRTTKMGGGFVSFDPE